MRQAVIDRDRAVAQRPLQRHQGRRAKAAECGHPIRLIDQPLPRRAKGLRRSRAATQWATMRRVHRALRRQRRADGRPEPPRPPPAPVFSSRARSCDLRPSSWRMAATWVASRSPVQTGRSSRAAATRNAAASSVSSPGKPCKIAEQPAEPAQSGRSGDSSARSRAPRHRAAIW